MRSPPFAGQQGAAGADDPNGVVLIMLNLPMVRALSTRRLILLATVANLGVAGLVVAGPPRSLLPAFSAADAAESVQRPVGFADLVEKVKPAVISVRVKTDASAEMMNSDEEMPSQQNSPM